MRCPDCEPVDRRQFLKTAALGTAGAAVASAMPKKVSGTSETMVTTLYTSLTPEQKTKEDRVSIRSSAAIEGG
jgi:hypothetical protein